MQIGDVHSLGHPISHQNVYSGIFSFSNGNYHGYLLLPFDITMITDWYFCNVFFNLLKNKTP